MSPYSIIQSVMAKNLKAIAVSLLLLAAFIALPGCGCGCAPMRTHVVVAVDNSGSFRTCLPAAAVTAAEFISSLDLDPDQDRVTLYRLNSSADEFYDGPPPQHPTDTMQEMVAQLRQSPAADGTHPEELWEKLASRFAGTPERVVIVLLTDGDNDSGPQTWSTVTRAAERLAANHHVCAAILGASPENWANLRTSLSPLGDNVYLADRTEMTNLEPVLTLAERNTR